MSIITAQETKAESYDERYGEIPVTNELYYRTMIVNAQTGEFVDPGEADGIGCLIVQIRSRGRMCNEKGVDCGLRTSAHADLWRRQTARWLPFPNWRQQVEAMGQWTQNGTVNGSIIDINGPIKVPDVDELPVIIVSRLEPDDEGLKQKISDGGELSYKDLSGMSIGKTDEQSIYNINIQQCRTRSYLCINDFWNYERGNDVAQMYANDNAYSLADVKEKMGELFRSLYPCEDEIELQKAEFNICYLSKDEKEVENGNLVGIGEYSLTGNQVIAGIPILTTAASGYKLEGKESRIEDEMRMMANRILPLLERREGMGTDDKRYC